MTAAAHRAPHLRGARLCAALALAAVCCAAAPAWAADVSVSGRVDCDDCAGPVGVDVRRAGPAGFEQPLFTLALDVPGPFGFVVSDAHGAIALHAFADDDRDGAPSDEDDVVAFDGNPVDVTAGDVADIVITIAAPATIQLSGVVSCPDCDGPIAVGLWRAAPDPATLPWLTTALSATGPFSLTVPSTRAAAWLGAFEDPDRDGLPAHPDDVAFSAAGAIALDGADRGDLDVDLAPALRTITLVSGAVTCGDCLGALAVAAWGPPGLDERPPRVVSPLDGPGPFVLPLPATMSTAWLAVFRDVDRDGAPDAPGTVTPADGNPIALEGGDVSGVTIALPPEDPEYVTLSGAVSCDDCAGPVGLRLLSETDGTPASPDVALGGPGPFAFAAPRDLGAVSLFAFRDTNADGAPDPGSDLAPADQNPLVIGADDRPGLSIAIPARPPGTWTDVAGAVHCDDCPGDAVVEVRVGAEGDAGTLFARLPAPAPGPFGVSIPSDFDHAWLYGGRDDDADGAIEGPLVAAAPNPVVLDGTPVTGVTITVPSADRPPLLEGEVVCTTCPGGAVVRLHDADDAALETALREVRLDAPGPFAIALPTGPGAVWVYALADDDGDGVADGAPVGWDGNPVALDGADVAGVVFDLDPPPPPADEAPADVVEPVPDVVEPVPDVVEPVPDVVENPADVVEAPADVAGPVDVVEPPADVTADTVTDTVADTVADTVTAADTDAVADTGADNGADTGADNGADNVTGADNDTGADNATDTGTETDTDAGRPPAGRDVSADADATTDAGSAGGGGGGGGCDAGATPTAAPVWLTILILLSLAIRRRRVAVIPRRSR